MKAGLVFGLAAEGFERGQVRGLRRSGREESHAASVLDIQRVGLPILIWTGVAERRDAGDDQVGIVTFEGYRIQAEAAAVSRMDVVNQDVRAGEEAAE